MDEKKKRFPLGTILLIVAIIVMVVQNVFLVQKTQKQSKIIEGLNQTVSNLTQINVGDSISAFTAMDLDSMLVSLRPEMYDRKVLLLVFTTWCHYCKENMGQWNQLVSEIHGQSIKVIGLCPDSVYKIRQYKIQVPITFQVYSVANDSETMKRNKLLSFPKMVMIDTTGIVMRVWSGVLNDERRNRVVKEIHTILKI